MGELKTLKELDMETDLDRHFGDRAVSTEKLRAEAIKWVKFYEERVDSPAKEVKVWIMHFFNLTEEDLK